MRGWLHNWVMQLQDKHLPLLPIPSPHLLAHSIQC